MPRSDLAGMIVGDLMSRWPETVPVLVSRRMACPGCAFAHFMTLAEAAAEHHVATDDLVRELARVIREAEGEPPER